MVDICKKTLCIGCHACLNICGKKAISMKPDSLGFEYPVIDASLCVDCGVCAKICPVNNPPKAVTPSAVYAAQSTDLKDLMSSTSGGAASVFSQVILKQGGIVYGCSGMDASHVQHIRIESVSELYKLKGSKYVQSKIGSVFKQVKADLLLGKKVLFTGTPCQVAGLKNFLRVEYENLITVDLVCHGVPSQQLLLDDISDYIQSNNPVVVHFRKKGRKEADLKYGIYIINGDGHKVYAKDYPHDYYIMGFMSGLFLRNSCFTCHWAGSKRCSDITVGDFWGLGELNNNRIEKGYGVSEVLLNTNKGENFFETCQTSLYWEKRDVYEAINGNGRLQSPSIKHPLYAKFRHLYAEKGFAASCRKCLFHDYKHYYINNLKKQVRALLVKTPGVRKIYRKMKKQYQVCIRK